MIVIILIQNIDITVHRISDPFLKRHSEKCLIWSKMHAKDELKYFHNSTSATLLLNRNARRYVKARQKTETRCKHYKLIIHFENSLLLTSSPLRSEICVSACVRFLYNLFVLYMYLLSFHQVFVTNPISPINPIGIFDIHQTPLSVYYINEPQMIEENDVLLVTCRRCQN